MINYIWAAVIVSGTVYMLICGNAEGILQSITNSAGNAVQLCISLIGIYCFWLGIMNVAKESGLIEKISDAVSPLLKKLFPNTGKKAFSFISMNIAANILGLGDAATPFGLGAMDELQKENPLVNTASDSMIMFIILNTASLQIIPTTVLSLRNSMGSENPTSIVITSLITTTVSAVLGIVLCKTFEKRHI